MNEWNNLDEKIKGTNRIHNPIIIRLFKSLHFSLSHLNGHKFRYNSANCVNLLCSFSIKPETALPFFCTATTS